MMKSPFKIFLLVAFCLASTGCSLTLEEVQEMTRERDLDGLVDVMDEEVSVPLHLAAVQGMAIVGGPDAVRAIEDALSHKSGEVRQAALAGLARNDAPPEPETLCTIATRDKDRNVRKLSEELIVKKADEARDILLLLLSSKDYRKRSVAVRCLGSVRGDGLVVARLIDMARRDPNSEVRKWAAISLGGLADPAAKPVLHHLRWNDPDQSVRVEAERALATLPPPVFDFFAAVVSLDCTFSQLPGRDLGAEFGEVISTSLARNGICRMIERTKISKALDELNFSLSDLADSSNAVRLGKMLSAQQIIYGEVQRDGNQYTVVVKRMNVETGEILQGVTEKAYQADLGQLKTRIADLVVRTF